MTNWYFNELARGSTNREPVGGEFFTSDSISDPGTALIRECIQNSLDASLEGLEVKVRIFLSGTENSLGFKEVVRLFKGIWPHIDAKDNGLAENHRPGQPANCPYLLIEDFNTKGLTGDIHEAHRPRESEKNHFYHFFRAEGQSDKDSESRGSWGLGKHVFHRTSRISTVFGYSIRADASGPVLMGKTILKSHYLGSERECYQDGYFGVQNENDPLVLPITDYPTIECLLDGIDHERGRESGLSIFVPWPDDEITLDRLVSAVVKDYFYPIIRGKLSVCLSDNEDSVCLCKDNFSQELDEIRGSLPPDLLPVIRLAETVQNGGIQDHFELCRGPEDARWEWKEDLFPADTLSRLRRAYLSGDAMSIRVPVLVRRKDGHRNRHTHFDVFLRREDRVKIRPVFIREGIIISDVKTPRAPNCVAIVVTDDPVIAEFVRDSENPSHTEWRHGGSHFQGRYVSGRSDLEFIKKSVLEIMRFISESDRSEDPDLLTDYFSIEKEEHDEEKETSPRGQERGGTIPVEKKTGPPHSPQPFELDGIAGGFTIRNGDAESVRGVTITVRVAYDVKQKNPISAYSPLDFKLDSKQFTTARTGVEILRIEGNLIQFRPVFDKYELSVTGFDINRDLFVKARAERDTDGDQEV